MSAQAEFTLDDALSFKAKGPAILFFRPRRERNDDECEAILRMLQMIPFPTGVMPVLIPHDMDLIAVGDAELEQLGLVRVEEWANRVKAALEAKEATPS